MNTRIITGGAEALVRKIMSLLQLVKANNINFATYNVLFRQYVDGSHRSRKHENEGFLVFMCFRLVATVESLWKENAGVEGTVPDPAWFFCSCSHKNSSCYIRLKTFLVGNL